MAASCGTPSQCWRSSWRRHRSRRLFEDRFGSPDLSIADFTASHAAHVRITGFREALPPEVTAALLRCPVLTVLRWQ